MPVRNEASFIARSLNSVLSQDYPSHLLEVIVADGMSDDLTRDEIRSIQARHPNLRLIDNPAKIVPTGMNLAIEQARGDIIVRVDGHTIVAPDYVGECVAALGRSGADNVGGRMRAIGVGAFGEAVALATSSPFGVGGARFHYSDAEEWVDTVYLGAWPRRVFERIGSFDEEQIRNQDDEFNYRLLSQGGKILLSPRIKSRYYSRSTMSSLWRQYFQYGYWKVRVMQKHPAQMRPRQFAPPIFVAVLVCSLILIPFSSVGAWGFGFTLGSYLAANLGVSGFIAARGYWRRLPLLTLSFAVLHLAYGAGFLAGLIRHRKRWTVRMDAVSATR
jgi:glycosyltransferase involved in cell wall biosynthesis